MDDSRNFDAAAPSGPSMAFSDEEGGLLRSCELPDGRTVHVCSIKALKALMKRGERPFDAAVLSSSWESNEFFNDEADVLFLTYQDILRETPLAFNEGLADRVRGFLDSYENAYDLLFCCEGGMSRSAALAAAFIRHEGFDDGCVWDNPNFSPNTLVYRIMLKAWGIDVPEDECTKLKARSDQALQRAIDAARLL